MSISWREANMTCDCGHAVSQHPWTSYTHRGPCVACERLTPEGNWRAQARINLQGAFMVERSFTYDDSDFAARMRVLPDYTVSILAPNITGVTMPGHE